MCFWVGELRGYFFFILFFDQNFLFFFFFRGEEREGESTQIEAIREAGIWAPAEEQNRAKNLTPESTTREDTSEHLPEGRRGGIRLGTSRGVSPRSLRVTPSTGRYPLRDTPPEDSLPRHPRGAAPGTRLTTLVFL